MCVQECVNVACFVAFHLSAEPAAILLPSVDQEHLSRFWKTETDVRKCIRNMTQPLYMWATVTVIRGKMEFFIRKDSREWWERQQGMKGDVMQLWSRTGGNTASRTAAVSHLCTKSDTTSVHTCCFCMLESDIFWCSLRKRESVNQWQTHCPVISSFLYIVFLNIYTVQYLILVGINSGKQYHCFKFK